MGTKPNSIDFHDILASSIHDIKNSLSMVVYSLEELVNNSDNHFSNPKEVHKLQQQTSRTNSGLIQLLTLYKIGENRLFTNAQEQNIEEFLEDLAIQNQSLASSLDITLRYDCDPDLFAYFDENLLQGVLGTVIDNALRYTRDQILVSAAKDDMYHVIRIEDNGEGFPRSMLEMNDVDDTQIDIAEGRTRLGFFFARKIAKLHQSKDRTGFIRLDNNYNLSGGCFSIWLP